MATVSRALSGSSKVRSDTRERIVELARLHAFEPNSAARSLTSKSSGLVGVLIDDIANPFFVQVVKGIEAELAGSGLSLIVASSGWDAEREFELARGFVRNRVDGVIVAPTSGDSPALDLIRKKGLPLVLVNFRGGPGDCWVCGDNRAGGRLAAEHLLARGFDRLLCLVGHPHQTASDRLDGFRAAVGDSGRSDVALAVEEGIRDFQEGHSAGAALVVRHRLDKGRTGVFAFNDSVASGFLKAMIELGIAVPGNVGLVGFDDIALTDMLIRPLTTIFQPKEEMGRAAASILLRISGTGGREPEGKSLAPRLVQRST